MRGGNTWWACGVAIALCCGGCGGSAEKAADPGGKPPAETQTSEPREVTRPKPAMWTYLPADAKCIASIRLGKLITFPGFLENPPLRVSIQDHLQALPPIACLSHFGIDPTKVSRLDIVLAAAEPEAGEAQPEAAAKPELDPAAKPEASASSPPPVDAEPAAPGPALPRWRLGFVFRLSETVLEAQITRRIENAEPVKFDLRTYYRVRGETDGYAFLVAPDNVLLLAEEPLLRKMLATVPQESSLLKALKAATLGTDVLVACQPDAAQRLLAAQLPGDSPLPRLVSRAAPASAVRFAANIVGRPSFETALTGTSGEAAQTLVGEWGEAKKSLIEALRAQEPATPESPDPQLPATPPLSGPFVLRNLVNDAQIEFREPDGVRVRLDGPWPWSKGLLAVLVEAARPGFVRRAEQEKQFRALLIKYPPYHVDDLEEKVRDALPRAAGMSNAEWERLHADATLAGLENQTLTAALFALPPLEKPGPQDDAEFRIEKPGEDATRFDHQTLAIAIAPSHPLGWRTVLQPHYLRLVTAEQDKDRVHGLAAFVAPGMYSGRVYYEARLVKGWPQFFSFRIPSRGLQVTRGDDGHWKAAFGPPEPLLHPLVVPDAQPEPKSEPGAAPPG